MYVLEERDGVVTISEKVVTETRRVVFEIPLGDAPASNRQFAEELFQNLNGNPVVIST